jgi:hypothetical protein
MPRERIDFFRESNSKPKDKIIVLAYEGNNTEAIYFETLKEDAKFNDDLIYLFSLRRPKNDTNSAPKHVFNKLKKEAKDKYNFDETDEIWMIIDRDSWSNIPEIFTLCNAEGNFYLALSNPCFELWILLHIKDLNDFNEQELADIHTNLKVSSKKTYLKNLLSKLLEDGYNESNPRPERFIPHIETAIERARILDSSNENFPTGLGSHVYKLVEKIIR